MKIIKKGSVKINFFEIASFNLKNKIFAANFFCQPLSPEKQIFCILSGENKILIKLADNKNFENSTVISTGYDWNKFNFDDSIEVFLQTNSQFKVKIMFYHKDYLTNKSLLD